MKSINWSNVEESTGGLKPGFYVLGIVKAEDVPDKEYVRLVYDIAEGPEKGRYSDKWGEEHELAHSFTMSYKDSALSMFKGHLTAFHQSNPTFPEANAFDNNIQRFVGCLVGACIQTRYYTYNGEDKDAPEVRYTLAADKVRTGDHKPLPEPRDQREKPAVQTAAYSGPQYGGYSTQPSVGQVYAAAQAMQPAPVKEYLPF